MHPELFELKALIAGRLDNYRRREIDDHLGSCAECSRHYVAMMLGSTTPKTAEVEARIGAVSRGAGAGMSGGAAGVEALAGLYGIDAPLDPPVPKAQSRAALFEDLGIEDAPLVEKTRVPVSASLVHAIAKLRAESDSAERIADERRASAAPLDAAVVPAQVVPPPAAPVAEAPIRIPPIQTTPLEPVTAFGDVTDLDALDALPPRTLALEPSVIMPTPIYDAAIDYNVPPSPAPKAAPATPPVKAAPAPAPSPRVAPPPTEPELVVTFSSAPTRLPSYRSPASVASVPAAAPAVFAAELPTATAPAPAAAPAPVTGFTASTFDLASPTAREFQAAAAGAGSNKPIAKIAGAALVVLALGIGGYQYFTASVSKAAAAAAQAAAKQAVAGAAPAPVQPAAPAAAAPAPEVRTRIVYVRDPKQPAAAPAAAPETAVVAVPVAVNIPDVSIQTGTPETGVDRSASRNATSELTRTARATASRTAAPRP